MNKFLILCLIPTLCHASKMPNPISDDKLLERDLNAPTASPVNKNERIQKAEKVFNELKAQNVDILNDFYTPDVHFQDPINEIHGLQGVKSYYAKTYKDVKSIHFNFTKWICDEESCSGAWTMKLVADGLNGGNEVSVDGNSILVFNKQNKVVYHRDYFDLGSFVYEQIPILKNVILYIKDKMK